MLQNLFLWVKFWVKGEEQSCFTIFLSISGNPISWEKSVKYGQDQFILFDIFLIHTWVLSIVHEYLHGQRNTSDQRNEITDEVTYLDL